MKQERRPLGTWGVVAMILMLGVWTAGLAYAQIGGPPHTAGSTVAH
jgi:hypothetical protein